ncbi:MAG: hypothetical protein K9H61_14020, partial [Bacteroidia bacterium]|nr:hypothetical protein [Bacteroidia bacterium]
MNHKLLNNSLLTSIAFAFSISILSCGSPKLSSYATNTNLESKAKYDFNPNKIRESGKGFSVDMKALGKLPKKIALISFYVDDPGLTKTTKSPNQSTWNTTNTGSDNARIFANQFYSKSIKTIKTTFKEFGMEVLTPNEFLKTEDQKIAYQNFVVKHTTLNKIG